MLEATHSWKTRVWGWQHTPSPTDTILHLQEDWDRSKARIKKKKSLGHTIINYIMQYQTLFWGAPKSLQMVTAAMKLKDAYSLEEKL